MEHNLESLVKKEGVVSDPKNEVASVSGDIEDKEFLSASEALDELLQRNVGNTYISDMFLIVPGTLLCASSSVIYYCLLGGSSVGVIQGAFLALLGGISTLMGAGLLYSGIDSFRKNFSTKRAYQVPSGIPGEISERIDINQIESIDNPANLADLEGHHVLVNGVKIKKMNTVYRNDYNGSKAWAVLLQAEKNGKAFKAFWYDDTNTIPYDAPRDAEEKISQACESKLKRVVNELTLPANLFLFGEVVRGARCDKFVFDKSDDSYLHLKEFSEAKYKPEKSEVSLDDELDKFLRRLFPDDELTLLYFKNMLVSKYGDVRLANLSLGTKGFTAKGIVKLNSSDVAIKIDSDSRLRTEFEFYKSVRNTEFSDLCPLLVSDSPYVVHNEVGFLAMTNLDRALVSCLQIINNKYSSLLIQNGELLFGSWRDINYNLFLMGLFHKSCGKLDEGFRFSLSLADYTDMDWNPHHLTTEDPWINDKGEAYERFKRTLVPKALFISQIDTYNAMLNQFKEEGGLVIIDGDWKPDNVYMGYKVDFGCMGYSLEIDDIAYYLSDNSFGLGFDNFKHVVGIYTKYRCLHDTTFRNRLMGSGLVDESLLASSWLRQLVLRHSVMKKRNLLEKDKFAQRTYYTQKIHEVLREGKFI